MLSLSYYLDSSMLFDQSGVREVLSNPGRGKLGTWTCPCLRKNQMTVARVEWGEAQKVPKASARINPEQRSVCTLRLSVEPKGRIRIAHTHSYPTLSRPLIRGNTRGCRKAIGLKDSRGLEHVEQRRTMRLGECWIKFRTSNLRLRCSRFR